MLFTLGNIFAQPVLLSPNPATNVYPITFTDVGQKYIVMHFDRDITSAGNKLDYTLTGTAATITSVAPGSFVGLPTTDLLIILNSSITYGERSSVTLAYTQPGGGLSGTGGDVATIPATAAVNNYEVSCDDIIANATISTDGICQTFSAQITGNFTVAPRTRNSIHFNAGGILTYFIWHTGIANTQSAIETFAGSGIFTFDKTYSYTQIYNLCKFQPYTYPVHFKVGSDPYLAMPAFKVCNSGVSIKSFNISAFCDDDTNSGEMLIADPPEGFEYCVGEDIPGVVFSNNTTFNCIDPLVTLNEDIAINRGTRYTQFEYATHAGAGIPNVGLIRGVGDTVWVTDNTGAAISFGGISDHFEGEVFINNDPEGNGPTGQTLPIYHKGNYSTDEVNDVFEVRMRIWGDCNPWDAFWQIDGDPNNDPLTTTAYLILIDAPPPPTVPDKPICFGGDSELSVSSAPVGVLNWYTNPDKTGFLANGVNYDPGVTVSGVYNYYVTDKKTTDNLCEGPATEVELLIKDQLTLAGPITGPLDVCQNETGIAFSVPAPTYTAVAPNMTNGGATEINWTVPAGWTITAGQGTRNITASANGTVGEDLTVSAEWRYTDNTCGSTVNFLVDVNQIPVGTPPAPLTTCENNALNINPQSYTNVASSTFSWSGNNGSSGTGIINNAPTNPGTTQINVIYSVIPTGPTGCVGSSFDITVRVDPETNTGTLAYAAGQDRICLGNSVNLTLSGYVGTIEAYRSRRNGGTWTVSASGANTRTYTPAQAGTWDYQARVQSGSCLELWGNMVTTIVDPTTVAGAVTPNRTVCAGSNSGLLTLAGHVGGIDDWEYRYRPLAGVFGAWTSIGNTSATYTSGALLAGTYEYRAIVTSGECLTLNSAVATITVDEASLGGTLTGANDVCNGGDPTALTLTGGSYNGTIIRWDVNIDGGGWNTVGGATAASYNPPATTTPGDHVYRVAIVNGACPEDQSTTQTIVVNNALSVTASATETSGVNNDMIICSGESVNLSASIVNPGTGTGYVYSWSGDNGQSALGASPTITPNTTGTIRYTVTLTDDFSPTAGGSCSATDFVDVTVLALPAVNIAPAGPTPLCLNTNLNLNGNAVAGTRAITDYLWTGDTTPLDADDVDDVVFNSSIPGAFNLTYTVTDNYGCTATDATTINVTGPVINIAASLVGVCENNARILTAVEDLSNSGGGESRVWSGLYGALPLTGPQLTALLSTTNNPVTSFNTNGDASLSTGTYTMIYTVTDVNGCSDADTIIVDVSTVTATITSDASVCEGIGLVLDGQPTGGTGVYPVNTWTKVTGGVWTLTANGDPTTATMTVPAVTGSAVYSLNYYVEDENGCSFTTPNYNVNVFEVPVADAGSEDFICADISGAADYTLAATASVGTGTWTVVSNPAGATVGFGNAASATSTINVDRYGDYILRWTEVNGVICSSQDEVNLHFAEPANAGNDQGICGALGFTLAGNNPTIGTGTWTMQSGPGTISFTNGNLYNTAATATLYGSYTLRWTITNGTCSTFDDVVIAFTETANAGNDVGVCGNLNALNLAGNTPSHGSGQWTVTASPVGSTATLGASTSPTSSLTVDRYGEYTLEWELTNPTGLTCSSTDEVVIAFTEQANAGSDEGFCSALTIATLAGNAPSHGTGQWTIISQPVGSTLNFSNNASPTSTATVNRYGSYTLRWTLSNPTGATCSSFDDVVIAYTQNANAGSDQGFCGALTVATLAGNTPSHGSGLWSIVSQPVGSTLTFSNSASPTSTATVNRYGSYTLRWTLTNPTGGTCSSFDDVVIAYTETATAGPDQAFCSSLNAATLAGNTPSHGSGLWSIVSQPVGSTLTFSNSASATSTATVNRYGSYTLRWTLTNPTGATCSSFEDVVIAYTEAAEAGPAQFICGTLATVLAGNTPSHGSGLWTVDSQPAGGIVSFINNTSPTTNISVNRYGSYTLRWTLTNPTGGTCSSFDQVIINFAEQANAGPNQYICEILSVDLDANTPTVGSGLWTVSSSDGVVSSWGAGATNPDISVTVNNPGRYTFRWTITNGSCSTFDETIIDLQPKADAGTDQHVACNLLTTTLAGNDPVVGRGRWTLTGVNPGAISSYNGGTTAADYNAQPVVSAYGTYTFRWTLENGNFPTIVCSSFDDVVITFYQQHTAATVADFDVCRDSSLALINISGTFGGGAGSAAWSILDGDGTLQNETTALNTVSVEYVPAYTDIDDGNIQLRLITNVPIVNETCPRVFNDIDVGIDEAVYVQIHESPSIFIAQGTSGSLTATISGASATVTTGTWTEIGPNTGGTFTPNNTTNNITFTPTAAQELAGGVTLRLTSDDPGTSCGPEYAEIYVGIGENPVADALDNETICEPTDMKITLVGEISGSATSGSWSLPAVAGSGVRFELPLIGAEDDNGTPADTTDDFRTVTQVYNVDAGDLALPNNTATLTFRLTTNDPDDAGPVQADWDEKDISIISRPDTPPISGGGKTAMCIGTAGQYYEVPNNVGNTYSWTIPPGVTISNGGTTNWVVLSFPNAGDYTVSVQEFTPAPYSCSGDAQTLDIHVYSIPVAYAGDATTICSGEPVTLGGEVASAGASATGGSGTYTYSWNPSFSLDDAVAEHPVATPASTRTYTLIVTDAISGCAPVNDAVIVTVNTISGGTIAGNQTVCDGTDPAIITSSVNPVGAGAVTYDWEVSTDLIGWTSLGVNALTYDPPVPTETVYYKRVAYSLLNGKTCSNESNIIEITYNSASAGTIGSDATICSGDDPLPLTSLDDGTVAGVIGYQWQSSVDDVNFFNIGGANFSTYDPPAQAVTTYFRRQILSTLNFVTCSDYTASVMIEVNDLTAGTITNDQTICSGGDPGVIGSSDDGTTSGGVSGWAWESSINGITYNTIVGANTPTYDPPGGILQTTYYRRIHTSTLNFVACSATSNIITVTVNNVSAGSISADQTICSGDDPAAFGNVVLGTGTGAVTYRWESSPDNATWTSTGGTAATYDHGVLAATTYFQRVAISTLNGVSCEAISNVLTVTVNDVDAGVIAGTQTVCSSDDPLAFTSTTPGTGSGAISYQWQSSLDNLSFVNIIGATSATYDPPAVVQTTYYKRIASSLLNGKSCSAESNTLTVFLNNVDPGNISGNQTICNGGDPVIFSSLLAGTGPGTISYRWESRTGVNAFAAIAGSDVVAYDPDPLAVTTDFRRITISTYNGVPCEAISNVLTVTVNDVTSGTIGTAQTICYGTSPASLTDVLSATGSGSLTYIWENSTDGITYNTVIGAISAVYSPPVLTQTTRYRRVVTSTLNGNSCSATSAEIIITVDPLPVAVLSGDNTICPGDATPLTITITTGTADYDVTIDNGVGTLNFLASPGVTNVSPLVNTTYNLVSVTDANGCTSNFASGNLSGTASIIVRDTVEITSQPITSEVCESTNTSFTVAATGDGLTYQWEYTDNLANAFADVDGSLIGHADFTQATMLINSANPTYDGYYYRVKVGGTCPEFAYSDTVQLLIKYEPISPRDPFDQLVCENSSTGFGVNAGITTNPTYQWQLSIDNGATWDDLADTAVYSGAFNDTLMIASASSRFNGHQYQVIITGDCGAFATSNPATLSVDERPEIDSQPVDTTVCEDNAVHFDVDAGNTTNAAYQWQVDAGSGFGNITVDSAAFYSGYNLETLNVLSASSRFDDYDFRVIISGDCPNPVTSATATLYVQEQPEITLQPVDLDICEGESPFFTVNGGVTSNVQYQWQLSTDGGTNWADLEDTAIYNGANAAILRLLSVPSNYNGMVYQAVVSGICPVPVESDDALLTVRERPEILEHPEDTTVCETEPVTFVVNAGVTDGAIYQWQVDQGLGFNNIGIDSALVYSGFDQAVLNVLNPTSRFDGYRYRVRVSGSCTPTQTSTAATLYINEKAEIKVQPVAKEICEENNTFFTVNAGVTSFPSYVWQVDMGTGFSDIGIDSAVYSGTGTSTLLLSSVPSSYDGYTYRVIVGGICPETEISAEVGLTVKDIPEILTQPVNDTVCEDAPAHFSVNSGITTGVIRAWYVNKTGMWEKLLTTDGAYTGVDTDNLTVVSASSAYNGYQYRVVISGDCTPPVTSETVRLIVDEHPEIIQEPMSRTICEDSDVIFVVDAGQTTIPTYQWEYYNGSVWANASGLGGVSDDTNDSLVITSVPSTYNNYKFRLNVAGKCPVPVPSVEVDLTVNEKPQIDTHPQDDAVCEQDTVFFFVDAGVTTNVTYNWQTYNGSSWVTPSAGIYQGTSSDTLFINGTNSSLNGSQYRVVVSGTCSPAQISDTAVLTVYERPEILSQPVEVEICENENASFSLNAGVTTGVIYKWEYYNNSIWQTATGGVFTNGNTNTLVLTNVPASMDSYLFRGIVSGQCTPADTSYEVALNVRIRPTILTEPVSATTCESVPTSFTVDAGQTYIPNYQWQYHNGTMWQNTIGANYSGANTATLNINSPNSSMHEYAYRVLLGGFCTPQVISDSVTLSIEENPEITLQPLAALICENSDTSFTIATGVTTLPTVIWHYYDGSTWDVVSADGVHTGFNTNTLTLTNVPYSHDNYRYYAEVSGKCGSSATSDQVMLMVNRRPEITLQPEDSAVCELGSAAFSILTGDTDGAMIQWEVDKGEGLGFEPIFDGGKYTGANTRILKVFSVDSIMTGYEYHAVVSGTCTSPVTSDPATLTVYSAPEIWTDPEDVTVCEGVSTSFEVLATGANINYFWQVDMGTGYKDLADTSVYTGSASNKLNIASLGRRFNGYRYRVRVVGNCNPYTISNIALLTINTGPEVIDQPQPDTICEYGNVSFAVNMKGAGLSYIWQQQRPAGAWQDLQDTADYIGTATPVMSIFGVERDFSGNKYRAIVSGICGSPLFTDAAELIVKTSPVIITQPAATTTICENGVAIFTVVTEGSDLTYQWQYSTGGAFSNLTENSSYSGTKTNVLSVTDIGATFNGYRFKVKVSGSCNPPVNSSEALLIVNKNPVINPNPSNSEICEGANTAFISGATGSNIEFQWEESADNGATWNALIEGGTYLDVKTATLSIVNAPVSVPSKQYRLSVFNACTAVKSAAATLKVNPNPTANIIGDGTFPLVCGGSDLNLDGNASGGTGAYTNHIWTGDVNPLYTKTSEQVVFNTLIDGTFNLVYTVTDSKNCKGSASATIENDRPNAQFTSDAIPTCGDLTVNFTNSSTGAVGYEWNFDDGGAKETTTHAVHDFDNFDPTVRYFNIELVATSVNICRDTANQIVTVYPKVDASFNLDPTEACQPVTAQMTGRPGASQYSWDFGDGVQDSDGGYFVIHTFLNTTTAAKTYTISLTTKSYYGCVATESEDIVVNPIPQPNFTVTPILQTYPSATVNITNLVSSPGTWSYLYEFGDGNSSTLAAPTHTYAAPGTYTITQKVLYGDCIDSIRQSVIINPTPPIANFNLPASGCTPLLVQFENTSLYANSYIWDFGDGSISTKKDPFYTYFEAGTYAVTLTVSGPGGSHTSKQNIEIWASPNLFFNNAPDSVYVNDKPVKFFNYSSDAVSYLWNFGDYNEEPTDPSNEESSQNTSVEFEPSHVYEYVGSKDVMLIGIGSNPTCKDTIIKVAAVYVSPAGALQFPNVFRPNPNGSTGGYYDPDNPATVNTVFFPGVIDQVLEYDLYIYNRWGEMVFHSSEVNYGWDGYIKERLAKQGVYIWKVKGKYTNGKNFVEEGDVTLLH